MSTLTTCDENLVQRLPLPLAKIYRRAHSARAKSALELHQASYYLWEASLKLLASTAIVAYAERGDHDPDLTECLKKISRPMLGHWWEFVRRLLPVLADAGDPGFVQARDLVLGKERNDLPKVASLGAALLEARGVAPGSKSKVRLSELFDRLVKYRNDNPGHGALGMGPDESYERMGLALLSAGGELLDRLDVLAGRRMIFVKDVRRRPNGGWLVERFELMGESPKQIESLEIPERDAARLPHPGKVYLDAPNVADALPSTMIHPLVVYDLDEGMVLFLNARRKQRTEYLSYTTGRHYDRDDLGVERRALLGRILDSPVDEADLARWEAESKGEQEQDETAPADEPSLRSLGEFELLSELGRGNMGVVYRAWQPSLGRQVAVKRSLRTGDAKTEARFLREISAMGRVDHPHLVKVFSSGFEGEHWYYSMELVEGATLSAVSDAIQSRSSTASDVDLVTWRESLSTAYEAARQGEKSITGSEPSAPTPPRQTPGADSPAFSSTGQNYVRQVVEIIRQSAEAAQILHEEGVIHRDIKPGNIMVTGDGSHAVLIDLGLAQLADSVDGKLTRTRQFVGTLRYASPEQVLSVGAIDHRTDIYSLGATLWELLTLRPLFGATDATPTPKLMESITIGDYEHIRRYNTKIPRDLDAIVQKCLEKDRMRRYATAADLAADLGRFLRGEVVAAQPPSLGYQTSKFVRRHKAGLATAAMVLLLIFSGTVAAFLSIDQERRATLRANRLLEGQQQETKKALGLSETNRKLAEQRYGEKRAALDEMLHRFSDDRLKVMPGAQEVRQVFLRQGMDLYQQILNDRQSDASVKGRLAEGYEELGLLQSDIGSKVEALASLKQAVEYRRQLASASLDDPQAAATLGDVLFELGQYFFEQQRFADAFPVVQESVAIFTRLLDRSPKEPAYKFGLGRSLTRLVSVRPDKSREEADLKVARSLLEEAAEATPKDAEVLTALARAINNYAASLPIERLNSDEGLALYEEASQAAEKALAANPAHSVAGNLRAWTIKNKAETLGKMNRLGESIQILEEAVVDSKVFTRRNPAVVRGYLALTELQNRLAITYQHLSRNDDAVRVYEEIVVVYEGLAQREPRNSNYPYQRIDALDSIKSIENSRGQRGKAITALDRALVGATETVRSHPSDPDLLWVVIRACQNRGEIEKEAGRHADAVRFFREGMAIYEKNGLPPEAARESVLGQYINCANDSIDCLLELKDRSAAIRLLERAIPLGESATGPDARLNWTALLGKLTSVYQADGQTEKAIAISRRQLKEVTDLLTRSPGMVYLDRGNLVGANLRLMDLYKASGNLAGEFEAMRGYLTHSTYLRGLDQTPLLAATSDLNEANVKKLRDACTQLQERGMKRFTVPTDFNGVKFPFHIYVSDSYKYTEDQFRWVEKVRGGKVPKEVEDSFRRLSEIAKENNVSFMDLCVYALGTANLLDSVMKQEIGKVGEQINDLKKRLIAAEEADRPSLRRRVAEQAVRLAGLYCDGNSSQSTNSANETLKEVFEAIPLDDHGVVKDGADRGVFSEALFVRGRIEQASGQLERSYLTLQESMRLAGSAPGVVATPGRRQILLGQIAKKLGRPTEAAFWFWKAAEEGQGEGVEQFAELYLAEPRVAAILPGTFADALEKLDKEVIGPKRAEEFTPRAFEAWRTYRLSAGGSERQGSQTLRDVAGRLSTLGLYGHALPVLESLAVLTPGDAASQESLAGCYGQLGRWKEAIAAHTRAADLEPGEPDSVSPYVLNLMEAYICAGDAGAMLLYVKEREGKSKQVMKLARPQDAALYHGLKAIGLRVLGLDATTPESDLSLKLKEKDGRITEWSWDQLDDWLKKAGLEPDRKAAVMKILSDMKGSSAGTKP